MSDSSRPGSEPAVELSREVESVFKVLRRAVGTATASLDLAAHAVGNADRLIDDVVRDAAGVAEAYRELGRATAAQAGAVRDAVRATPRFLRIVGVVVGIVASYRIFRARGRFLDEDARARRLEALHARNADKLYRLCIELRGGLLKVGQFLSCRADILPAPYIAALSQLQDRVPAVPTDEIVARIREELVDPDAPGSADAIEALLAGLDDEPLAAASLAQVHVARLADGRELAVKVQVPGIEEVVEIDVAALRAVAGLIGDAVPHIDAATTASELARSLIAELDYPAEADSAAELAALLADDPRIVVPPVDRALSRGRVLVMALAPGQRPIEYLDEARARGDEDAIAAVISTLIDSFAAQILRHGVFHADPHPGNFLVDDQRRVVLLDFGAVGRLSAAERRGYAGVVMAVASGKKDEAARILAELGFRTRSGDSAPLAELAGIVLDGIRSQEDLAALDPRAQIARGLDASRRAAIEKVPESFVMIGRVLASIAGLYFQYRPQIALLPLFGPHLMAARAASD